MGRNFKGQIESEVVLTSFRKHWIQIVPSLLILPLLLSLLVAGFFALGELSDLNPAGQVAVVVAYLMLLFFLHRQFMSIFHWYMHTVIVTNFRIVDVDKSVYFNDSKDSVDLSKVQDIQKRQNGVLENVFNFGSLHIVLSGTHASVELTCIPRPEQQFKRIHMVKQQFSSRPYPSPPLQLPDESVGHDIGGIDGTRTRDLLRDRQAL